MNIQVKGKTRVFDPIIINIVIESEKECREIRTHINSYFELIGHPDDTLTEILETISDEI